MGDYMYNSIDTLSNQYKLAGMMRTGTFDPYSYVPQYNPVSVPLAAPTFNFGFNRSSDSQSASDSDSGSAWGEYRSSAKKSKPKTEEEKAKETLQKEADKTKKETIDAINERIKETEKQKTLLEAGKRPDGSASDMAHVYETDKKTGQLTGKVLTTPKNRPWWKPFTKKQILRFGANTLTAGKNLVTGIFGFEKDGSWNWKKAALNTACIAGAIGLSCIPYVGPFIGTALLTAGAVAGTYGAIKGGIKVSDESDKSDMAAEIINNADELLKNAKTPEERAQVQAKIDKAKADYIKAEQEIDNAQQDVASNVITTILSCIGLKQSGTAFRTGAQTSANASSATARTSWIGKAWQSTSNFFRDLTINPWKSAAYTAHQQAITVSQIGFRRTWGRNISQMFKGSMSAKDQYEKQLGEMEHKLYNRIREIQESLNDVNIQGAERAMLQEELGMVRANLDELYNISTLKTKADFEQFKTGNFAKTTQQALEDGEYVTANAAGRYGLGDEIVTGRARGRWCVTEEEFAQFSQRMAAFEKAQAEQIETLMSKHQFMMYKKASHPWMRGMRKSNPQAQADARMVRDYLRGADKLKWYKMRLLFNPGNMLKSKAQMQIGSTGIGAKTALKSFGSLTLTSPESTLPKLNGSLFNPVYASPMVISNEYSAKETAEILEAAEENNKVRKEIKSKLDKAKTPEEIQRVIIVAQAFEQLIANDQTGTKKVTMEQAEQYAAQLVAEAQRQELQAARQAEQQAQQQAQQQAATQQSGADRTAS